MGAVFSMCPHLFLYPVFLTSFPSYQFLFVELESRVFFQVMFFLNLGAFGRCTGITFVGSMMIPVCHNLRRYANKVFKVSPPMGKELWAGVTASNCILRAMTEARL